MTRMVWMVITLEYLKKLYKILPGQMAGVVQSKGPPTAYWWLYKQFVSIFTAINELVFKEISISKIVKLWKESETRRKKHVTWSVPYCIQGLHTIVASV